MHPGPSNPQTEITTTVERHVAAGKEQAFARWAERHVKTIRTYPGFRGISFIDHGDDSAVRTILYRFATLADVKRWDKSKERKALLKEVNTFTTRKFSRKSGMETWFTLKGESARAPEKWKMALATFSGVYLVTALQRELIWPFVSEINVWILAGFSAAITVCTLTWIYMPLFVRVFHQWLYPRQQ